MGMKLSACLLIALALAAGCGKSSGGSPAPRPPGATIEFGGPERQMQTGSYCWSGDGAQVCGDSGDPSRMPGLPKLRVTPGTAGRIHLGFDPVKVQVSVDGEPLTAHAGRTVVFTPDRSGLLEIFLDAGDNDVAYYARLILAGPPR
jgi:hypothetical protein